MVRFGQATIRPRLEEDVEECVRLAQVVHAVDGYPPYLPNDDFRALLTTPEPLAAYVAVAVDNIVGHVALHSSRRDGAVMLAADMLHVGGDQLGVVARLFGSPQHRRIGIGTGLLAAAADAARDRGLIPILDVWVELRVAIAMYESCGWRMLGTLDAELPDGRRLPEHVFVAPG